MLKVVAKKYTALRYTIYVSIINNIINYPSNSIIIIIITSLQLETIQDNHYLLVSRRLLFSNGGSSIADLFPHTQPHKSPPIIVRPSLLQRAWFRIFSPFELFLHKTIPY